MIAENWAAVIPAYNAAASIEAVVKKLQAYLPLERILIVDDGSTDETANCARKCGAQLIQRGTNGGKGCALRAGFDRVLSWNPDWIICLDADGQHNPEAIPKFYQTAQDGQFDLIVGNRRKNLSGMPLARRFSNITSSALISLWTGLKLPDAQCGYRALRADLIPSLNLQAEKYEIEAEMLLRAWKLGLKIGWMDIPTIYQGEPSSMRKFPETIRFLKTLAASLHE